MLEEHKDVMKMHNAKKKQAAIRDFHESKSKNNKYVIIELYLILLWLNLRMNLHKYNSMNDWFSTFRNKL